MKKAIKILVILTMCSNIVQVFALASVKGRVTGTEDNQAIEFENVVLQTSDSVYVTGTGSEDTIQLPVLDFSQRSLTNKQTNVGIFAFVLVGVFHFLFLFVLVCRQCGRDLYQSS